MPPSHSFGVPKMVTELLVPRPGLIVPRPPSYVKLDMAFGVGAGTKLFDKSRYRSHGAITGASWATGLHGKCLDFDPTIPSYVEIPASHNQLNFTSEDFSIIARLSLDVLADACVVCRGLFSSQGWLLRTRLAGYIDFATCQSGATQFSASSTGGVAIPGFPYTIGISRSGAAVTIYVNGVADTASAGTHNNPTTCTRAAKIGTYDQTVEYRFDGKIEFFRIFGGIALSASEHLAWHNALA